jgi:hypothetical protein
VDWLLTAIEATAPAQYLRSSRWGYAAVSGAHVLGIALLVGAIVPLNLRLLGLWRDIPVRELARVLVPVAATGLCIAILAGLLLFSVRASEYAVTGVFQAKLVLIAAGILGAIELHRLHGLSLASASSQRLAAHAAFSLVCWLSVLACGRLIAFVVE